jgi:leucyl aminopeptidase
MHPSFLSRSQFAIPLEPVTAEGLGSWTKAQDDRVKMLVDAMEFRAEAGKTLVVTGPQGTIERVVVGLGDGKDGFVFAGLPGVLPAGDYVLTGIPEGLDGQTLALGWADGAYRFARYKPSKDKLRRLVLPNGIDAEETDRIAEAIDWLRDLVNTPPCDMGPVQIAEQAEALAREFNAACEIVTGEKLETGYPMVHAVGKGAEQAPRYIEIVWGREDAPKVAIVGKGVSFDTGGLNIKTSGMAMMKKDMGGAAHAMALAKLVMGAGLDVRLTLSVPAVENAIDSKAFRPSDILTSRKGLTVEIDNTDAEGRLILADALTKVSEGSPELVIDFATLTGAARTAVGPDLAPFYTDDEQLAAEISAAAKMTGDPAWRMPLWVEYDAMLSSSVADMKNAGDSPMAGSITAALFLKKFVSAPSWVHLDIWAWRLGKSGRPAGAAACGLRAMYAVLKGRYAVS